ncbi:pyruvate kinase [Sinobacterium caligoides]|uniref:pyruvate kinase n=1 Tax=Sinobacterium caligoides TaxID=933926 RepID=UPI000F4BBAC7|nr:pyruvate kinase [Sinobacterium caligoides]
MQKRSKIVATLGPASESREVIRDLIRAGVNVVRLNFSHGSAEEHALRAQIVREEAAKLGQFVAVLGDLQGPKIRVARFKEQRIELTRGDQFSLDANLDRTMGDQRQVGIDYAALADDCVLGDTLLLDDGRVQLVVEKIDAGRLDCRVTVGGPLSNNKGINRQGGGLSAPALTEKDLADICLAAAIDVDYLAVSFPRSAEDIEIARRHLSRSGSAALIVAKLERAEAVNDHDVLDQIILASDAVMVARGDLGVEIGDAELIGVQKHIISRARTLNRMVITATQMMESMIENSMPTRAEVFDVANAVIDGTDAVMLSAESAAGAYPVQAVEAMTRVILGAEKHPAVGQSGHRMHQGFSRVDESIAMSVMYAANHLEGVKAIVCMTESGFTPRIMSRISSRLPIFAFARHARTRHQLALCRGVQAVDADMLSSSTEELQRWVSATLQRLGTASAGDLVIVANGHNDHCHGGTNTMSIIRL